MVGLTALTACTYEEEDLFDQSAAQRLNASAKEYRDLLTSSQYGWVMEFWPNNGTMGGYMYVVTFKNDGFVDIIFEEDMTYDGKTYQSGDIFSSNYSVKSEKGTVLSFDTYNPFLHYFTEPKGSSNVSGYNSDYEFSFMRTSENQDTIYFRGKKYGQEMKMIRFSTDPAPYMAKRAHIKDMARLINRKYMTLNGQTYDISLHMKDFVLTEQNGSEVSCTWMPDDKGIKLSEEVVLTDGTKLSYFYFDEQTGEFKSPDNKAIILCPSLEDQFNDCWFHWMFQIVERKEGKSLGDPSLTSVDELYRVIENDALMGKSLWDLYYNNTITSDGLWGNMELFEGSGIKINSMTSLIYLSFGPWLWGEGWFGWENPSEHASINNKYYGKVYLTYLVTNDFPIYGAYSNAKYEVKFHCLDEISHLFSIEGIGDIDTGDDVSRYGFWWIWMGAIVNRTYKVEFNDEHCPTVATFTATDDPDFWFTLKLNKLMESRSESTSAAKAYNRSNNRSVRKNNSWGSASKISNGILPYRMNDSKQIR